MAAATHGHGDELPQREDVLAGWIAQVLRRRHGLAELLGVVHRYAIPGPAARYEA